jgi:apolipoprotein N-acyltransferase
MRSEKLGDAVAREPHLPCVSRWRDRTSSFRVRERTKVGSLTTIRLLEYTLLAFSSLFVIVDPISTVPTFLAMTDEATPQQRIQMARLACWVMAGVLIGFSWLGKWLFSILGITLPAFEIAGSLVLLLVALEMASIELHRGLRSHLEREGLISRERGSGVALCSARVNL